MKLRIIKFLKDFLLSTGILRLLSPFNSLFLFIRNFNLLRKWIGQQGANNLIINDFYCPIRDYNKRLNLFQAVSKARSLAEKEILYLEFGVASGNSFRWWSAHNQNPTSVFRGFDTFEGLPEDWGGYAKGAMAFTEEQAVVHDPRGAFVKGIFQDSLNSFIDANRELLTAKTKVIHLDADLFSSTIFVLSQLYPFLRPGDIVFFDEFNVANHEFLAWKIFTESFYVKMRCLGAVNNFYQTAFIIE